MEGDNELCLLYLKHVLGILAPISKGPKVEFGYFGNFLFPDSIDQRKNRDRGMFRDY